MHTRIHRHMHTTGGVDPWPLLIQTCCALDMSNIRMELLVPLLEQLTYKLKHLESRVQICEVQVVNHAHQLGELQPIPETVS